MVGKLKIAVIAAIAGSTMMLSAAMHEKGSMKTPESVSGGDSCVKCHQGIESIRDPKSDMMKQIVAMGKGMGDSGGTGCRKTYRRSGCGRSTSRGRKSHGSFK